MTGTHVQNATRRQNIEQERSREAWNDIQEAQKTSGAEKEYRTQARGLNAMIQINGLGQTLGYLKAKGKNDKQKAHYLLLKHLTNWMKGGSDLVQEGQSTGEQKKPHFTATNRAVIEKGDDGLLQWVMDRETTSADYRRATTECLAFGTWLSRFAEAELKGDE